MNYELILSVRNTCKNCKEINHNLHSILLKLAGILLVCNNNPTISPGQYTNYTILFKHLTEFKYILKVQVLVVFNNSAKL